MALRREFIYGVEFRIFNYLLRLKIISYSSRGARCLVSRGSVAFDEERVGLFLMHVDLQHLW